MTEWVTRVLDRLMENPEIGLVFFTAFCLGAFFEWVLEHVPFWYREWKDRRRARKREKQEGPQAFEKRTSPPRLPARPQPPATGAIVRGQRDPHPPTQPVRVVGPASGATAVQPAQPDEPARGRHRPRQRDARFFARSRRYRGE